MQSSYCCVKLEHFSSQALLVDSVNREALSEVHAFLRKNGFTDDLAQVVDRFGSLDALAAASEAQLVAVGLPKLKARRLRQLLHTRSESIAVS